MLDDVGETLHVGEVAAHVRQQQETRAGSPGLAIQILKVDHHVLGDFDKQRFSPGRGDGAGYRGERESVGENRLALAKARRAQGDGHGISPRGTG